MTQAVCLKCGKDKFGALTPCPHCRFLPTDVLDRAKSLLLSDHFADRETLNHYGQTIIEGNEPQLNPDRLNKAIALFEAELLKEDHTPARTPRWKSVLGVIGFALIPFGFLLLMPPIFALGDKLAGRSISRPERPLASGIITELRLENEDGAQMSGHRVAVYSDYLKIDAAPETIVLPRERVQLLRLKSE